MFLLAELLAGSEPPSRSKGKEENLPPCPELFVVLLTQDQSLQRLFLTLGANKNTRVVTAGQTPPSLRSQDMYFEALITGIGGINRQDCRPEDFLSGKSAQGGEDHIPRSSKQDRSPGIP